MVEPPATNAVSVKTYGAVGDGVTDDGPAIRAAFLAANDDATIGEVVFEDTASEAGYLADMSHPSWTPWSIRANLAVRGEGWGSRVVRAVPFEPGQFMFRNRDGLFGDDGMAFHDFCVDGQWSKVHRGDAWIGPGNPMNVIMRLNSEYAQTGSYVENFVMTGCRFYDWPGVPVAGYNMRGAVFQYNVFDQLSGGGIIMRYRCDSNQVLDNQITRANDDCLAYNATTDPQASHPESGVGSGNLSRGNVYSRVEPSWAVGDTFGACVTIRGGTYLRFEQDTFGPCPSGGFAALAWMPVHHLTLDRCLVRRTRGPALEIGKNIGGRARELRLLKVTGTPRIENQSPKTFTVRLAGNRKG